MALVLKGIMICHCSECEPTTSEIEDKFDFKRCRNNVAFAMCLALLLCAFVMFCRLMFDVTNQ